MFIAFPPFFVLSIAVFLGVAAGSPAALPGPSRRTPAERGTHSGHGVEMRNREHVVCERQRCDGRAASRRGNFPEGWPRVRPRNA